MATKLVKEQVERYADVFRSFYGKSLQVQVKPSGITPFVSKLITVRPATLQMMKGIAPDQREKADGKTGSPPTLLIEFEDGELYFVIEDIENIIQGLRGITLNVGGYRISFMEEA